jgi:hypothetical protein
VLQTETAYTSTVHYSRTESYFKIFYIFLLYKCLFAINRMGAGARAGSGFGSGAAIKNLPETWSRIKIILCKTTLQYLQI